MDKLVDNNEDEEVKYLIIHHSSKVKDFGNIKIMMIRDFNNLDFSYRRVGRDIGYVMYWRKIQNVLKCKF
jgi:hypothetical protein